ncbi:MAG TPA: pyridoxal-phosphate dependent enzyme [Gemmatimonadaceae bacterium]
MMGPGRDNADGAGAELSLSTIYAARALLRRHFPPSRLVRSRTLSARGAEVHLKLESELPTGSFKPRGALWALAANLARRPIQEVTASSTGNHGAAVAYAAGRCALRATVFLQRDPDPAKRALVAALGATIVEVGDMDLSAATRAASEHGRRDGVFFLDDATDPDLPAGPATIALEIIECLPSVDTIIVPVGDTALIRGVAAAAKQLVPRVRIIGVQAERAPSYTLSWRAGHPIATETCDTIADGLATRSPDGDNVRALRALVDDMVLVSDADIRDAMGRLFESEETRAEPAGAAATAALLAAPTLAGSRTVVLVTGANGSRHHFDGRRP